MGVGISARGGEREKVFILKGIFGDGGGWHFESLSYLNKDGIHLGQRKLEGAIILNTVHSHITIQLLQTQVCPIVVRMIIYRVTCFNNESLDMVTPKDINCPVVKISAMSIIEDNLSMEKSHTQRRNGSWILATHCDSYILMEYCGLPSI